MACLQKVRSYMLIQETKGFKLLIYYGQLIQYVTTTINWLAIPTRNTSSFFSGMIARFTSGNTHINFKMVDCPFHNRPDLIKGITLVRISGFLETCGNLWFRTYGRPALLGSTAGILTVADSLPFYRMDLGTAPFIAVNPSFSMTMSEVLHTREESFGQVG